MRDLLAIPSPEAIISEQTGDELDFEAARAVCMAHNFRVALKEVSPKLDIFWAKPGATVVEGGYWYIFRRNPVAYWQVCDDDGSYCEPDERHLRHMMRIDASRHQGSLYHQYSARRERRKAARDKELVEKHREFREKLLERLEHHHNPRVAITPAMKARADGENVTAGGVVLPDAISRSIERSQGRSDTAGASTAPPAHGIRGGADGNQESVESPQLEAA